MSIGVQSYPELYTLLLGWSLYGKLWNLLTQTGIAYVPFIGLILKNVTQSYVMSGHQSAGHSLRSMEISLITTFLLIFFGVAPFISLDAHTVTYSPICGSDKGKTYFPGATGTTYDKAFALPAGEVRVPIWWYAVISTSAGMTSAANTMIGCVPDLRKMMTEVDMAQIQDPETKQELQDFETMCYTPAKTQFLNDSKNDNATTLNSIRTNTNKYGAEDTEWMGSHGFSEAYYRNLKATRAVPGFPYDAAQDMNADTKKAQPVYGAPNCFDWWNDSKNGLKNRLYQTLPKSFADEFKDYIHSDQAQDDVVKKIITNAPAGYSGYDNGNNTIGEVGYSHAASSVGIWYHQMNEYPRIYAASQAAPIVQALLLLLVYVFLPFALVFSGYKPSSFVAGAVLIFSLIFWAFIWHLVSWADKSLMQALYTCWFAKQGAGASLTDMIIGSLVIGAPLFWFSFMGSMGASAMSAVNSTASGMSAIGNSATRDSMKSLSSAADMATGTAKAVGTLL
ncbi:MAG: conjugal transfer protein TraG N-terminal domain-containing protein [Gammaproteobacteria bacterium]